MPSLSEPWVVVWLLSAAAGLALSVVGLYGAREDRVILHGTGLNGALNYVAGVHVRSWWARVTVQALSLTIALLLASIRLPVFPDGTPESVVFRLSAVHAGLALVSVLALAWAAQDLAARRRHLGGSS